LARVVIRRILLAFAFAFAFAFIFTLTFAFSFDYRKTRWGAGLFGEMSDNDIPYIVPDLFT
jgi:hypothetical protein